LEESLKQDSKQNFCYSCGKNCSRVRYHNVKNPPATTATPTPNKAQRYDLCSLCFQEGRFPSSTTAADYVKLENEKYQSLGDKESPWGDAELLLLLEGLELFDDNWESVAEHVGSRTREECVLKFLQLEIEDKFVDDPATTALASNGNAAPDLTYLSNGRLPYSQYDNPIMSVMGFLAGLADPATTAKAAGRSVEEMRRTMRARLESGSKADDSQDKSSESVKNEASGQGDTSMDVDSNTALATSSSTTNDLATTALSLTAARAAALASHTERQLTNQVSAAVNLQLQKLELKLSHFAELEALLHAERREVERMRHRLFLDRLEFRQRVREAEEKFVGFRLDGPKAGNGALGLEKAGAASSSAADVEMYAEGSEGFMKHEI
jgi:SWI/SNF related-matrix-associated actin-dependent regulator of chromatin subfamily C